MIPKAMSFLQTIVKYIGVEVQLHIFLNSGLDSGEVVSLTLWPLYSLDKSPGTHFAGDWVATNPFWTSLRRDRFLAFARIRTLDRPACIPSLQTCVA